MKGDMKEADAVLYCDNCPGKIKIRICLACSISVLSSSLNLENPTTIIIFRTHI
jgi:hypothetical protein